MLEFKYIWGCGSTDWWVRDGFPKSSFDGNRRSSWWQGWAWVMREKRVMRIYHINYGQQEWGLWTTKNMIRGHWSWQGSLGWLSFKSNDGSDGSGKKAGILGTWVDVCQSVALPVMDYQGADAEYGWFELMTGNGWENMNGKNWWQGESAAIWAMTDKIRMGLADDREELREGASSISIRLVTSGAQGGPCGGQRWISSLIPPDGEDSDDDDDHWLIDRRKVPFYFVPQEFWEPILPC